MNYEKEPKTVEECLGLFDKYISEGDKDKAKEFLIRASEINKEIMEKIRKENERIMKKYGNSAEDLPKVEPDK